MADKKGTSTPAPRPSPHRDRSGGHFDQGKKSENTVSFDRPPPTKPNK